MDRERRLAERQTMAVGTLTPDEVSIHTQRLYRYGRPTAVDVNKIISRSETRILDNYSNIGMCPSTYSNSSMFNARDPSYKQLTIVDSSKISDIRCEQRLRRHLTPSGEPTPFFASASIPMSLSKYLETCIYEGKGRDLLSEHKSLLPSRLEVFQSEEYVRHLPVEIQDTVRQSMKFYGSAMKKTQSLGGPNSGTGNVYLPNIPNARAFVNLFPEYEELFDLEADNTEPELTIAFRRPSWGYYGLINTSYGTSNLCYEVEGTLFNQLPENPTGLLEELTTLINTTESIPRRDDNPQDYNFFERVMERMQLNYPGVFGTDLPVWKPTDYAIGLDTEDIEWLASLPGTYSNMEKTEKNLQMVAKLYSSPVARDSVWQLRIPDDLDDSINLTPGYFQTQDMFNELRKKVEPAVIEEEVLEQIILEAQPTAWQQVKDKASSMWSHVFS
jgi:hypothetical protein